MRIQNSIFDKWKKPLVTTVSIEELSKKILLSACSRFIMPCHRAFYR